MIESKLYWAACQSEAEALYLAAIFNAPVTTARLTPLQSRGEHNPRDFHKLVFQLPIPRRSRRRRGSSRRRPPLRVAAS